jgi:TolB-like protein
LFCPRSVRKNKKYPAGDFELMKNILTIILLVALIVFLAYFTVKQVKDNAGFMVPEVDRQASVEEDVSPVKSSAVKVQKKVDALVREDMTEKPDGDALQTEVVTEETVKEELPIVAEEPAEEVKERIGTLLTEEIMEGPVKEALPAIEEEPDVEIEQRLETLLAEEAIEGPSGDAQHVEKIFPPVKETPVTATENLGIIAADIVPEEHAEDMLSSEIQRIIAAAEEAAERAEEGIETSPTEGVKEVPVEEALPAVEEEPVVEIEEWIETLLAEEEIEEPVIEALPAVAAESAEQAEEVTGTSQAEDLKEGPVEEALPVAEKVDEKIDVLPEESITEAFTEELPPAAVEGPSREVEKNIRSLLESDSMEGPYMEASEKIAVLSFDNFSNDNSAVEKIMPGLKSLLKKKGLVIVNEDSINDFLCKEKVRLASYISKELARKMKQELKIDTMLAGSVISFNSGDIPQIALLARLIDASNGNILWADYASLSGSDFTRILGRGTIKTMDRLIPRALDRLLASFVSRPYEKNMGSAYRIAVMPFNNKSKFTNAGMIATYMFLVDLLKHYNFEPIGYGEVRKLIVDLRIRNKGELEYKNLKAFSEALNINGVLIGTVERYSGGIDSSSSPNVAINARLLDARNNRILWYNSHESGGEKKIIAFDWGGAKPVDMVAHDVVSELVKDMETVKWHQ